METGILLGLQSIRVVGLTQLAALVYALGNAAFVWIVLAVVWFFFAERRQTAMLIVASVIVTGIVCSLLLAPMVGRVRPCDAGIGVTAVIGVSQSGFAFPCSHAATSFAAATVILLTLGAGPGLPSAIVALLISLSSLYLGVNYPTDVLAGIIIGIIVGVVVAWAYNTFFRERFIASIGTGSGRPRKSVKRR